ncbi:sigma 54-interacting transcriptional regulator [Salinicoccus sp. HZC-1]|uniref:sigma 54-interacting transcriptional regulator n=1 Tax=Salinicoccus sp. HZC-1 TaxID=3385497 RepID=UPI00398B7670
MDKRLFIIGIQEENLGSLKKQMEYIFGGSMPVIGVTLKDLTYGAILPGDVVLLSSYEIGEIVKPFLPESCTVIVSRRTINIVKLKNILTMQKASRFMVVNDNPAATLETIEELGNVLPDHEFLAYMAHEPMPENFDFIITPGEAKLVPTKAYQTFDIGARVVSIETVLELKELFELEMKDSLLMQYYIKTMVHLTAKRSENKPVSIADQNKNRTFSGISTESTLMESTIKIARRMAKTSNIIHITGETGTGKQMLAEMIHNESAYHDMPFYIYSGADKDPQLIEDELFGGTGEKHSGILREINRGTVYIKNIDSIPYQLQNKLANYFDKNTGSSDIRIMTSSIDELWRLYKEDVISQKLYSYLSSYILKTPSISERKEDIPVLINDFKKHFNKTEMQFSDRVMNAFVRYDWPGNVRELYNLISYCVCLNQNYVEIDSLPIFFKGLENDFENGTEDGVLNTEATVSKIEKHGFLSESIQLLNIYKKGKKENTSYGRGKVRKLLLEEGVKMTDQQLRLRIEILDELELLNVRIGRAGTTISEKGEKFLEEMNKK